MGMEAKKAGGNVKNKSAGNPSGYLAIEDDRGRIVIDPSTGHILEAPSRIMNSMQREYYNARVDLDHGRVGAQDRYKVVVENYAKMSPAGFNRAIADAESIYQTGKPYQPTAVESAAYFTKLGGAMLGTGAVVAVGDAVLLGSAEAAVTYGPQIYAASKAAAYSAYATAMTAAATPAGQQVLQYASEFIKGFSQPTPPMTPFEFAGAITSYREYIDFRSRE